MNFMSFLRAVVAGLIVNKTITLARTCNLVRAMERFDRVILVLQALSVLAMIAITVWVLS